MRSCTNTLPLNLNYNLPTRMMLLTSCLVKLDIPSLFTSVIKQARHFLHLVTVTQHNSGLAKCGELLRKHCCCALTKITQSKCYYIICMYEEYHTWNLENISWNLSLVGWRIWHPSFRLHTTTSWVALKMSCTIDESLDVWRHVSI